MFSSKILKSLQVVTAAAVVGASSLAGLAAPAATTPAEINVVGNVTLNGTSVASGGTLFSGSTLQTGPDSSAVVTLGQLGMVEIEPNSTVDITYSATGIESKLTNGQVYIAAAPGVKSEVTSPAGVVSSGAAGDKYAVNVCGGQTQALADTGNVSLNDSRAAAKSAPAGVTLTSGDVSSTTQCPVLNQNRGGSRARGGFFGRLNGAGLGALLAGIVGAVIIVIIALNNNDANIGGTPVIISPTR